MGFLAPGRDVGHINPFSVPEVPHPAWFSVADSQLAECRGPPEVEGAPLFSLTEESFKACHLTLTLDDYLFIAFVGFVVSIASVATNFLLGITANCCHRWSKASEEEEI
jgi:hypothetical protein